MIFRWHTLIFRNRVSVLHNIDANKIADEIKTTLNEFIEQNVNKTRNFVIGYTSKINKSIKLTNELITLTWGHCESKNHSHAGLK